ncbi:hypothetical protein POM88_034876 [Heracleum sosnowskyi]|uniref:Uncharacterized protein n=1 Tax=Heracleum sosnowskyi TaxID=360622 RepID=A0AAD8HKD9_9APIA|nr:hypothetical protein POM88_034876 [Heracleum sosnowskyi]
MFDQWMFKYSRVYKDAAEKEMRFTIFKNNAQLVEVFSRGENKEFNLTLNKFADLTDAEFRKFNTSYSKSTKAYFPAMSMTNNDTFFKYTNLESVPNSIDWRDKGAMCGFLGFQVRGSCYAFSAVAAVEGITYIKQGKLISLSEQEIIDCSMTMVATRVACRMSLVSYKKAMILPQKQTILTLANKPGSVAVDSSNFRFRFYSGGVFNAEYGTQCDHAITIVGYGANGNGDKYWILKNSWGTGWGEGGYGYFIRDVADPQGICGIATDASFPII